jgi:hypothetical protein
MSRFDEVVNEATEEVVLVVAERHGVRGELRCEVQSGERNACHTTRREWLDAS